MKKFICFLSASMIATGAQAATTVDLSGWTAEGNGNWQLQSGNDSVKQFTNGEPTVFYSDYSAFGNRLSGTIKVETASDDDFVGFVVGYNPGDLKNSTANYLLIDWKRGNQTFGGCYASAGLAVTQVTGAITNASGTAIGRTWCHDNDAMEELARGNNLASIGWADNTEYSFDIEYTASSFKLFVDGVEEVALSGNFTDGRFGFYNYSQANVLYAGITNEVLPAVPEPATWAMMLAGFGLLGGAMRRAKAGKVGFAAA